MAASLVSGSKVWPCQKRMSQTRNWTVRVVTWSAGRVYSPTRNRKKNAMTIRSAVALAAGEAVGATRAADAIMMALTGKATWGLGTGSLSL